MLSFALILGISSNSAQGNNSWTAQYYNAPYVGQNIVTQISRNAIYPIIGRTADSDWYQIRVGTTVGWVSARYIIAGNITNVPIANA